MHPLNPKHGLPSLYFPYTVPGRSPSYHTCIFKYTYKKFFYYYTNSFCFVKPDYSAVLNNAVERYLSPESGRSATIVFPLFSGLLARMSAAFNAAPDEIPTSIPSLLANVLPSSNASSFSIVITSSYTFVFYTFGTNPAPIP